MLILDRIHINWYFNSTKITCQIPYTYVEDKLCTHRTWETDCEGILNTKNKNIIEKHFKTFYNVSAANVNLRKNIY